MLPRHGTDGTVAMASHDTDTHTPSTDTRTDTEEPVKGADPRVLQGQGDEENTATLVFASSQTHTHTHTDRGDRTHAPAVTWYAHIDTLRVRTHPPRTHIEEEEAAKTADPRQGTGAARRRSKRTLQPSFCFSHTHTNTDRGDARSRSHAHMH
jgi:hypothetical protein